MPGWLLRRSDVVGLGLFLASVVIVNSLPHAPVRLVVLGVGWAGLLAFLLITGRDVREEWFGATGLRERSAEYLFLTIGRMTIAVAALGFVAASSVGTCRICAGIENVSTC